MHKVGFIGLGIMGQPMAKNILKAGYSLIVYNRSQEKAEILASFGAEKAESPAQLARKCDVIITMLPNSTDVKELILNKGVAENAAPGTLIIDMTSGSPDDSRIIYTALKEKNIHFIDAPVSGGEPMAINGTLSIMVGGEIEDFNRAKPLFGVIGNKATWVGPIGSGNTCKLVNQIIVAINIAGLAEGLMLAEKAGANTQLVLEAIKNGLAGSAVMDAKAPMMLADNYKPGFRIDLHIKDLTNAINAGIRWDTPLLLTPSILEIMKQLSARGDGNCDHSAIAKYYKNLSNTFLQVKSDL